ncbi:MAG: hypothetical protein CMQ49_14955 [Gammaproteobacteria bacterium]|nr:hypothetical protein [Gammaproteobacteria bacterium]
MKRLALWGLAMAVPLALALAGAEAFYRSYAAAKTLYQYDASLGWRPIPNFTYQGRRRDSGGARYPVAVTTNEHGFRAWGNPTADRARVLFVGDSFTADLNMSDADAYFGQVADQLDAEVFAVGAGGYGTLQELMLVEAHAPIIAPHILVLQFCANDLANNSFAIESASIVRNQKNLRPYWQDGAIIYRLADHHWYKVLYRNFALFRFFDQQLQNIQYRRYGGYRDPAYQPPTRKQRQEADVITEQLFKTLVATTPTATDHLTFATCNLRHRGQTERWTRIANNAGFTPLPQVGLAVDDAAKTDPSVLAADGAHWAPRGHAIAGATLAQALAEPVARANNAGT